MGQPGGVPRARTVRFSAVGDVVYAIDTGLVTTVLFLAGVSFSLISREKVLLAGFLQIIAGALAIFFGAYISTKAQKHFFENQIEREKKEGKPVEKMRAVGSKGAPTAKAFKESAKTAKMK